MKTFLSAICIVFVALIGCNTPFYSTVNNMSGQPATISFVNGLKLDGILNIKSFDNYSTINTISFAQGNSKLFKTYSVAEVKELYLNGSTFCAKELVGTNMWGGSAIRFVKRLTLPESKMQLYEHEVWQNFNGKNEKQLKLYLQLPNASNNLVFDDEDKMLVPNFDEKMSEIVKDCSSLAQKIRQKQSGYFYAFINLDPSARKRVLLNIINEYNNCN